MFGKSMLKAGRRAAAGLIRSDRGNVAAIFALALVPMIGIVGAAIDYSRAVAARSAMQAALDTAALMVSKDAQANPNMTADQATAAAQKYFNALYKNGGANDITIEATYTQNTGQGATVQLTGSGSVATDFMRMAGFYSIGISTDSQTKWGNTRMRVALVLDNTGSMDSNNKMTKMQSAAKDLVDKLATLNKVDGDVYVSIVPFAKDVNVGTSNVSESWLNWSDWESEPPYLLSNGYPTDWQYTGPGSDCPFVSKTHGFTCTDRPATVSGAKSASTIPSSGTYSGMICPSIDSGRKLPGRTDVYYNGCYTSVVDQVTTIDSGRNASCGSASGCSCSGSGSSKVCKQTTYKHYWRTHPTDTTQAKNAAPAHSTWTGCVNDRNQPYDTTNDTMTGSGTPSKLAYPEQWKDCLSATVSGMSNSWSNLKTQITNMVASGNTNQPIGLAWGWQTLNTANGPFKAPAKDPNSIYNDYIVLLSDGMNTQNRWSTTQSAIDARQAILCQNVKDATQNGGNKITIFTIQVNINKADPQSTALKNCATGDNFQMITSADQTADAFNNIFTQIAKLRISQ